MGHGRGRDDETCDEQTKDMPAMLGDRLMIHAVSFEFAKRMGALSPPSAGSSTSRFFIFRGGPWRA
jgi:hypothetical protein